ncbi:MAG: hypothetical protein JNL32_07355 [Candidatus Kapabacteria bacterium]|nr:hypothetical protein [Candidatus Kapabacteria bacterium]
MIALFAVSCEDEQVTNTNDNTPIIKTVAVTNVQSLNAVSGGEVISDGGSAIVAKGVCWGTSALPTINDSKTNDGNGTSSFTSVINGLNSNTSYFLRAYATNTNGKTGYGEELTFTTKSGAVGSLATITINPISTIFSQSANSTSNVTNNGGSPVTARGVCWGTMQNPTISLATKTNEGGGSGVFNSTITGLTPSTTYFVRAYATNGVGTSYSTQVSFTTKDNAPVPVLTTKAVELLVIDPMSMSNDKSKYGKFIGLSGGDITSDGGSAIDSVGICWSTSTDPTIGTGMSRLWSWDKNKSFESRTGNVSDDIHLIPNTTYYLRAFARNANGVGYGNMIKFTTTQGLYPGILYQGGVVAYVLKKGEPGYDQNVEHGLIITENDVATSVWANAIKTISTDTSYGTGIQNTTNIVRAFTTADPSAALACLNCRAGNRSDWYLPSLGELRKIMSTYYTYSYAYGHEYANFTKDDRFYYWTSSRPNNQSGYGVNYKGIQTSLAYNNRLSVRAVRSF